MTTLKNLDKYSIILASQSPRRRELLSGLNIDFRIKTIDVEEDYPSDLLGEEIPMYLAEKKALAYVPTMKSNNLLITADTIVICEGEVLNKPSDQAQARQMLETLSGKTHQVITAVCIQTIQHRKVFNAKSECQVRQTHGGRNRLLYRNLQTDGQSRSLWHTGVDRFCRRRKHQRLILQHHGFAHTKTIHRTEKLG